MNDQQEPTGEILADVLMAAGGSHLEGLPLRVLREQGNEAYAELIREAAGLPSFASDGS